MDETSPLLPPIRLRSNAALQPASSLEGHDVACTYKVTHADKTTYPPYELFPSEPAFSTNVRSVPSLVVVCVRRLVHLVHELDKSMLQDTWTRRRYDPQTAEQLMQHFRGCIPIRGFFCTFWSFPPACREPSSGIDYPSQTPFYLRYKRTLLSTSRHLT
jgi:hypothetical protein